MMNDKRKVSKNNCFVKIYRDVLFEFHLKFWNTARLLTGLTAQQKGATARWYSNKKSLQDNILHGLS